MQPYTKAEIWTSIQNHEMYFVWFIHVNLFKSIFSKNYFLCNDDEMVWLVLQYTTLQYTTI